MLNSAQQPLRNQLLLALAPEQFDTFLPHLEPLPLPTNLVVCEAGAAIEWAVFPETGLISVIAGTRDQQTEVGVYGREGMGPVAVVLGGVDTPFEHRIRASGYGYRLPAAMLRDMIAESTEIRLLFQRYALTHIAQLATTAHVNARLKIEQRLARWLMMAHDRADRDELHITHESLSLVLGVRRTGVTLAIHVLEGEGMIRARRGLVTIRDRAKLNRAASDGYGLAEGEYERLIGAGRSTPASDTLAAD